MPVLAATTPVLGSILLISAAIVAHTQGRKSAELAAHATRVAVILNLVFAGVAIASLLITGPQRIALWTLGDYGLDLRLDALSVTLFSLVAFVGAIVVRFSRNYLDKEPLRAAFLGDLCLTLAAVSVLVLSGNLLQLVLAWIATSLALHRLLLVFGERPGARTAARKKFMVARLADVCLIGAAVLLIVSFGTAEFSAMLAEARALAARGDTPGTVHAAALLLVLAACLKSAQFPTHGWLLDVVDTPTPVSALLHAGLINAGGFLIVRFSDVIVCSGAMMLVLALIGGFTALFGSLAMLTQTSVKLSLVYSTVAQMGFMLFQCGLGAFSAAILHLVAHSLYKAHAFTSSGGAVQQAKGRDQARPLRPAVVLASLFAALVAFALAALVWDVTLAEDPAILALGSVLVLGLTHVILRSSEADQPAILVRTLVAALAVSLVYFGLQHGAAALLANVVAKPAPLGFGPALAMTVAVIAFALVTAAQWFARVRPNSPAWQRAYVHLKHGLYIDARFNRWLSTQS